MKYFLVSWLVSSTANNNNWIKNIVSADSADEALLKDLIHHGCLAPETTMQDVEGNREILTKGEANNLKYTADIIEGHSNSEELMIVTIDCGAKVFIPLSAMDSYELDYIQNEQACAISTVWEAGGVKHIIEDVVWENDINKAIAESLFSCLPMITEQFLSFAKSGFNTDYRIELNNEACSLAKVEILRHTPVTIDGHKIDILIPRSHTANNAPVLAKVVQ